MTRDARSADLLNESCHCMAVERERLFTDLDGELPGLGAVLRQERPHLFAAQPVFIDARDDAAISAFIDTLEALFRLPAWRERTEAWLPADAPRLPTHGVLASYDFHLDEAGPQLIEINTNAGGALLNAWLLGAVQPCCKEAGTTRPRAEVEADFLAMFRDEWRLAGRSQPIQRIAIVDENPAGQYLHPEFQLFAALFHRHGIDALIVDRDDLVLRADGLYAHDQRIDLVYNRLTDFYLEQPANAALREAWLSHRAVITPDPSAYARYADKRNLALLSDDATLNGLGLSAEQRQLIHRHLPETRRLDIAHADEFWDNRKQWFFKPAMGFGSRAGYRGDKLTRRVWDEIVAARQPYLAQRIVTPSERQLSREGDKLKLDLRCYTYGGQRLITAARLYRGQTTNFRTPGGGFAPVLVTGTPDKESPQQ